MSPKRQKRVRLKDKYNFLLIFFLTIISRLVFILTMQNHPYSTITRYTVDSFYYHEEALNIKQANWLGKEVSFLNPFYPYFLALIYTLFGIKVLSVQIIQTILSGLGAGLLYLIGQKIFGRRSAIIASIGYIFSGILIFYTGALLYVEVNIFLSLLLSYLLLRITERRSSILLVLSGIVLGLFIIVRPDCLFLMPLLLPYFILRVKPKPLRQFIFLIVPALITISTVALRNYIVGRDFVLFAANSGINFYYGNNPEADGTWRPIYPIQKTADISIASLQVSSQQIDGRLVKPSVAANYWLKKGLNFITRQPIQYLKLLLRKFLLFINSYEIPNNYYFYETQRDSLILKISFLSFGLVLPLAVLGIILSARRVKELYLLHCFIICYLGSALIFYVLSRLRAPVIPFLLLFGAYALSYFYEQLRAKRYLTLLLLSGAGLILFGIGQIKIIDKRPFSVQGFIQQGDIYQTGRKPNLAVNAYGKALGIDPKNVLARYGLLHSYISLNRPKEARQQVEIIERLAPGSSLNHLAKARYNIALNNFIEAAKEFERALIIDPNNAETHYLLGAVYINLNRLPEALIQMERALQLNPAHSDAKTAWHLIRSELNKQSR